MNTAYLGVPPAAAAVTRTASDLGPVRVGSMRVGNTVRRRLTEGRDDRWLVRTARLGEGSGLVAPGAA